MRDKISKLKTVFKKYGFMGFIKKIFQYIQSSFLETYNPITKIKFYKKKKKLEEEIMNILHNTSYERIIVWRDRFGWNTPLFQRPQQIAQNLARQHCLIFYEVTKMTDTVDYIEKKEEGLYLVNFNNKLFADLLFECLNTVKFPKYIDMFSTNWDIPLKYIQDKMNQGFKFIYEYIDHISPDLSGTKELPQNISDKYTFAMSHKEVIVVVTADELKKDVVSKRGEENLVFSSNGVDYSFFQNIDKDYQFEEEFTSILNKKKPIVCYYGALAKWFDYELLKKIAKTNKYSVVLFGIKYDGSYDENMNNEENIYFLGPRDYKVLKNYSAKAYILILPFILNDITKSTSPCKLFEYMSLHKPIVTTDLLECRKYKSVMIGKTHDEFLKKLEEAMKKKKDSKYIDLLDKEGKDNDWSQKAEVMIELLKNNEKNK